jgi:hypothetical protein
MWQGCGRSNPVYYVPRNAVAWKMNFAGRGGKVAIQKLKLLRVIIGMKFKFVLTAVFF